MIRSPAAATAIPCLCIFEPQSHEETAQWHPERRRSGVRVQKGRLLKDERDRDESVFPRFGFRELGIRHELPNAVLDLQPDVLWVLIALAASSSGQQRGIQYDSGFKMRSEAPALKDFPSFGNDPPPAG